MSDQKEEITVEEKNLVEFHCIMCGKLLLKESILIGKIEIKCASCGAINTMEKTVDLDTVVTIPNKSRVIGQKKKEMKEANGRNGKS